MAKYFLCIFLVAVAVALPLETPQSRVTRSAHHEGKEHSSPSHHGSEGVEAHGISSPSVSHGSSDSHAPGFGGKSSDDESHSRGSRSAHEGKDHGIGSPASPGASVGFGHKAEDKFLSHGSHSAEHGDHHSGNTRDGISGSHGVAGHKSGSGFSEPHSGHHSSVPSPGHHSDPKHH